MKRVRRWQRRYLPAEAVGQGANAVVFTWSGMLGITLVAVGWSVAVWSAIPLVSAGTFMIGWVAAGNYRHAMMGLRPQLVATDEDREVAKLKFEAEIRKTYVGKVPSIIGMFAINGAATEAQQIGVPVEELQEIANRLFEAKYREGSAE